MTKFETWNSAHCDIVPHHAAENEMVGDGERSYVEHVRAQKLTVSERFVVLGALVLLGVAGLTAHFGMPTMVEPAVAASEITGSVDEQHPVVDYCREYSPYAERDC